MTLINLREHAFRMIFPAEKWNAEEVAALHVDSRRRNRSP